MQRFERGQQITYKCKDGNTYTGMVQDLSVNMLGVIRGTGIDHGAYDAVYRTDVLSEIPLPTTPLPGVPRRAFQVGGRVRMIAEDPVHGRGGVRMGHVGVITHLETDGCYECKVDFPAQKGWNADFADLEHEAPEEPKVEVSLEEAVASWQNVVQQIKELQSRASVYERVMREHGVKPI